MKCVYSHDQKFLNSAWNEANVKKSKSTYYIQYKLMENSVFWEIICKKTVHSFRPQMTNQYDDYVMNSG